MGSKIKNQFVRKDGTPARSTEVLRRVATRIARYSAMGKGCYLTPCEVRALDWAVLRDSTIDNADIHWLDRDAAAHLAAPQPDHHHQGDKPK